VDDQRLAELVLATADEDPLIALAATAQMRKEAERLEAVLVRRARNNGVTWPEIAAVLGISKQAVHKKYGGRRLFGGQP
jgi:Homeodomain-like domain-containing protein